jgi:hypothetical protein
MKKLFTRVSIASILALIVLLMTTFAIPCTSAQGIVFVFDEPECWGVFVGISEFANYPAIQIHYGDTGEQALYSKFASVWGSDHCRLLTNSQATKNGILDAIDWVAGQADSNDTVLFSVRSYGEESPGGNYYFYTYNSLTLTYANDISSQELSNAFDDVNCAGATFILSFPQAGGFNTNLAASGRVIEAYCQADEAGYWDPTFANCVFLHYVIEAINNFDTADTNHDYNLSAEEIYNYAAPLTTTKHADQHPKLTDQYSGELPLISKFVFNNDVSLPAGATAVTIDGSNYTSDPQTLYWTPGGSHTVTVPELVNASTGTRYVFTGWEGGSTASTIYVSKGTYTANYNKEYQLTLTSPYDTPTGDGWYVDGTSASFSITASLETADTKRFFTGWSGDFTGTAASGSIVMNAPKSITANWRTEFLLTITSDYGTPTGAGWYDEGESAAISVEAVQGFIIRHIFDGWTGGITSTDASTSVTMNGPKTITATWHTDYLQLYILIIIVVVVLAIIIVVVVLVRRKPRGPAAAPPTYSPPPTYTAPPPAAGPPSAPPPPPGR